VPLRPREQTARDKSVHDGFVESRPPSIDEHTPEGRELRKRLDSARMAILDPDGYRAKTPKDRTEIEHDRRAKARFAITNSPNALTTRRTPRSAEEEDHERAVRRIFADPTQADRQRIREQYEIERRSKTVPPDPGVSNPPSGNEARKEVPR